MHRHVAIAIAIACCAPTVMWSVACEPVKLPNQMPGPPGCGMRDPRESGPSTLSVAQNMVLKNNGHPATAEPNEHGGRSWVFYRSSGSVFGEQDAADLFVFDAQGLLVSQKTEVSRKVGK
jgi:hypothetical protein